MPHIYLVSIDLQTYLNQYIDHKIIGLELLRLEKISKVIKSNH